MGAAQNSGKRSSSRRLAGTHPLTRRQACLLAFGGASALALSGCGGGTFGVDTDTREGFGGSLTEVKSYPVTLKWYVDKDLKFHGNDSASSDYAAKTSLETHIKHYQAQQDRSDVSFDIEWVDMYDLQQLALDGFPDGDAILGLDETVYTGIEHGTVYAGDFGYEYFDEGEHFNEISRVVRAKGSKVELPPSITLDGADSADGMYNQLQQLPKFKGHVAVADPYHSVEGRCANKVLASEFCELYTYPEGEVEGWSGCGGEYDPSIAEKMRVYPTQKKAMAAVASGECELGFSTQALADRYPGLEICYAPPGGMQFVYTGTALPNSEYAGVVWDFLTLLKETTW